MWFCVMLRVGDFMKHARVDPVKSHFQSQNRAKWQYSNIEVLYSRFSGLTLSNILIHCV